MTTKTTEQATDFCGAALPDGSLLSVERDVRRWGATFSEGDWRIVEI